MTNELLDENEKISGIVYSLFKYLKDSEKYQSQLLECMNECNKLKETVDELRVNLDIANEEIEKLKSVQEPLKNQILLSRQSSISSSSNPYVSTSYIL